MATLSTCVEVSGDFQGILRLNTSNCKKAGGLKGIWVADANDVDIAASVYNATDRVLESYTMLGGGVFYEIEADGATTEYTYSKQDNGNYLSTLNIYFKGTSAQRAAAIEQLEAVCPAIVHVQLADCTQITSLQLNGSELEVPSTPVEITGDELTSGTEEGDQSSQVITITWTTSSVPVYAAATEIPT